MDKKDILKSHPNLCRAILHCKIGRDAIDGKTSLPVGCSATDYALFCLLYAIEEIAEAMLPEK